MNSPLDENQAQQNDAVNLGVLSERLEEMSPSELAEAMEQALNAMTEETYDPGVIDAYLNALEQKKPDSPAPFRGGSVSQSTEEGRSAGGRWWKRRKERIWKKQGKHETNSAELSGCGVGDRLPVWECGICAGIWRRCAWGLGSVEREHIWLWPIADGQ